MSLSAYHKKRRFNRTPEPRGASKKSPRGSSRGLKFVIQKHDASRLHYDFRLELDGVLKSWAVPKGPSLDPDRKALAVQVEDHPLDYGEFEGVIPKGEYGGGTVLLWDAGTWTPLHDPADGLRHGKLHFRLDGEKLHGEWSLVRMHGPAGGDGRNWLLMKLKDEFADADRDVLQTDPQSVKTSRTIEQIAGQRDDVWSGEAKATGNITGAKKSAAPAKFSPQLAVLADDPPTGDAWVHEIKFDGYRIFAHVKAGEVKLITRNGHDWTHKFPAIAKSIAKLKVDFAVVDGEAVVLDAEGRSDFQSLQAMLKSKNSAEPTYFIFDLPFCDGFDLRESPLIDRKAKLREIFDRSKLSPRVQFSDHVRGDGEEVIRKACGMALEGIISKRADAPYVSRRDASWLKSKCGRRQEFVIIGFTDPDGARSGFGSLLLGYHDAEGRLVYAGRVGTGFGEKLLAETVRQLRQLRQDKSPTDLPVPPRERRAAHWVKPKLVAEVKFSNWTQDGMLRHPAFVAFRTDKPAAQIVREVPLTPAKVKKVQAMTATKRTPSTPDKPRFAVVARRESTSWRAAPKESRDSAPSAAGDASSAPSAERVVVAGVRLSHPDKLLWPDAKVTKQQLADYYDFVARWMLPHVIDRPLALLRCPAGNTGKCFFQRNWTETLPPAVGKVDVGSGGHKDFHISVADLAGVVSLAQVGVLEIHTWNCKNKNVERPDQLIFDLDPGPDVSWKRVIDAAKILRQTLESLGLPTFLKTSGGKGLHVTIPISPNVDWDAAKSFSATIAKSLARQEPELFVANMRKDLRGGKIYLDYNRNGRSATAVAPYSSRARDGAPVSMPISWEELGKLKSANHFTVDTARRYLEKRTNDPWRDFERSRVDLRKLVGRKSAA